MKHHQPESQQPDKRRHCSQSEPTWCCCPLHSLVLFLSIFLTSIYLVSIAASAVFWVLHDPGPDVTEGTVLEVSQKFYHESSDRNCVNYYKLVLLPSSVNLS